MTTRRSDETEELDDLTLSGPELTQTLSELGWINQRLGLADRVARAVVGLGVPDCTVVDLGCGGGDVLAAISRRLPAARLHGIDGNPETVAYAAEKVDASFMVADILAEGFVVPPCDVVVTTHFLYHLPDSQIPGFVEQALAQAQVGMVIGELQRSALAERLFGWVGPLAGLSRLTLADGQRAVRRAFTAEELRGLLGSEWEIRRWGFSMIGSVGRTR